MRLGEWRKAAPNKEAMSNRVLAILRPVLVDLGAEADAECWVAWGEDPESRYSVLAPTSAGLITVAIRLTGADGPRATAKLIRWSKLSVSELGIEASGGHRLVAVQVESHVLKGIDADADRICEFVRGLIAGIDGRHQTYIPVAVMAGAAVAAGAAAVGTAPAVAAAVADSVAAAGAEEEAEPEEAAVKVAPKRLTAVPAAPAEPKPTAAAGAKAVPPAPGKAAPKQASKPAEKPAALAIVPGSKPAEPAVQPVPPTPIAARTAAHHGDQAAATSRPAVPEPEPDRSEWIGPHPIEEPSPAKPRPWKP
jgi:hypothetical protein